MNKLLVITLFLLTGCEVFAGVYNFNPPQWVKCTVNLNKDTSRTGSLIKPGLFKAYAYDPVKEELIVTADNTLYMKPSKFVRKKKDACVPLFAGLNQ